MKVVFLAPAQLDLDNAVAWYDHQAVGLGTEFLDELDRAARRIAMFPTSCPEIEADLRRCLLARFPFGLIYGIDGLNVVVVAVAHLHREPRYWMD